MTSRASSVRASTRWVTRIIPLVLTGCVGFAIYVVVRRACVQWFLEYQHRGGVAAAFLAPFFIFLLAMMATYLRLLVVIKTNPGLVPLGPGVEEARSKTRRSAPARRTRTEAGGPAGPAAGDIEALQYDPGPDTDDHSASGAQNTPDLDPDSPGLEQFYSKDVFVCDTDGRPRWCSACRAWKPDRAHHSRELNRCVRKMDHYCPWVGGIVSETSFKFFVQFVFYTSLFCIVTLAATALSLKEMLDAGLPMPGDLVAILAIAGFFGLFTFSMTLTSVRYVLINLTNVDVLRQKSIVHQLAIRIPRDTPPRAGYGTITYPLPHPPHLAETIGLSARDMLATRSYAIVRTDMGENPWDLGAYRNWTSVMGNSPFDWILPVKMSPCVGYENNESFYQMGPLYYQLRARYGLPEPPDRQTDRTPAVGR